jgi:integrase
MAVSKLTAPGLHFVGGVAGLALQVTPGGARAWTLRVSFGGRRRDMGLGAYPAVTLAMARDKAREARELIRQGIDPIERQRAARSALLAAAALAPSFEETAKEYIGIHEAAWKNAKHAQQWRNTLSAYAYPVMGELRVRDVQKEHVLVALRPLWTEKNETASRLRSRIELVLSYAMQAGYRPEGLNPARWKGGLDKLLPAPSAVAKRSHHRALPVAQVGAFMQKLRIVEGMGARALEFAILTAARSGEVRGATWSEIDLEGKVWTVPAARMKAGKEHRVPLSTAALALLKALAKAPKVADADPGDEAERLVFPASRGGQLSDMTLSAVLRRMKVAAVPHGFRSTFRDWAAERSKHPHEVAEMALAHAIENKSEAAYRRGDLLEKRRAMMADWAAFLAHPEKPAKAVPLKRKST